MGWTYFTGNLPTSTLLSRCLDLDKIADGRIVEHSHYDAVVYLACKTEIGTVGAVVLVDRRAGETGCKIMDETVCPFYYQCPAEILDLLTEPAPNSAAQRWRSKCRENLTPAGNGINSRDPDLAYIP